jgi:predicted O-linked N-acetylglucosamine transferase (SPINDLY family)
MRVDNAIELYQLHHKALGAPASAFSNVLMISHYSVRHHEFISQLRPLVPFYFAKQNAPPKFTSATQPESTSQLRLGFISADLCSHPVGFFCWSWLSFLAQDCWVGIYDQGATPDTINTVIRDSVQRYTNIGHLSDALLFDQIVGDKLDVLIDLSGHTRGNRLSALSMKPAPILVNYLGYFSSTFLQAFDAVIMDEAHMECVPQNYFEEVVYCLPRIRFCYKPPSYLPPVTPLPAKTNGHITFACFANTSKFSEECLGLWSSALAAVPQSRWRLKWKSLKEPALRERLWLKFEALGNSRSRVELYPDGDHHSLFYDYQQIDIALDTYPFSSATTSCEAMSMGIPVITCGGSFPAANQTLAILRAVGLDAWAVVTPEQYIERVVALTENLDVLEKLRLSMRASLERSMLFNAKKFASDFHLLIRRIVANAQPTDF